MKKALTLWLSFLLVLLITSFFLVSCKSTKTINDFKKELKKETSVENNKTTEKTEISEAITENIQKPVAPVNTGNKECDSLCDAQVDALLQQLDFYKQSGTSTFKMYYDRENRLLNINASLEERISRLKDSVQTKYFNVTKTVTKTKEVPVKYIPSWIKILASIGALSILFWVWKLKGFFN